MLPSYLTQCRETRGGRTGNLKEMTVTLFTVILYQAQVKCVHLIGMAMQCSSAAILDQCLVNRWDSERSKMWLAQNATA